MSTFSMRETAGLAAGVMALVALMAPLDARQSPTGGTCRISGHATSGTTPLPGVALTIRAGETTRGATSTELDGAYALNLPPGQYTLSAELTGFSKVDRPLVVGDGACAQTVDLALSLAPRQPLAAASRVIQQGALANGARGAAPGGARGGRGGQGFETVQVQPQAEQPTTAASAAERESEDAAATRLLLPPGFS